MSSHRSAVPRTDNANTCRSPHRTKTTDCCGNIRPVPHRRHFVPVPAFPVLSRMQTGKIRHNRLCKMSGSRRDRFPLQSRPHPNTHCAATDDLTSGNTPVPNTPCHSHCLCDPIRAAESHTPPVRNDNTGHQNQPPDTHNIHGSSAPIRSFRDHHSFQTAPSGA